jgi:hypothetical protein
MPTIERFIDVGVPLRTAYNQWTQFESFPLFMDGVREVQQLDSERLHWRAIIGGVEKEWDAAITEQTPDRRVAWQSTSGARNDGVVSFEELDGNSTRIHLLLTYELENIVEKAGDALGFVTWKVEHDLRRFRDFIESRGQETGAWRGEIHGGAGAGHHTAGQARELDEMMPHTNRPSGQEPGVAATGTASGVGGSTKTPGDVEELMPQRAASSAARRVQAYAADETSVPVQRQPEARQPDATTERADAPATEGAARPAGLEQPHSETSFNAGHDPFGSSREADERRSGVPQDRGEEVVTYPGISGSGAAPNADPSWNPPADLVESSDTLANSFDKASQSLHSKVRENEELMGQQLGEDPLPTLDGEETRRGKQKSTSKGRKKTRK